MPARAGMKILKLGPVEQVQPLVRILHRMAVNDARGDGDAGAGGGAQESLEFLRRSETGGDGEEVADVVAERAVVRVLHDGHKLHGVVTEVGDARQDALRELL